MASSASWPQVDKKVLLDETINELHHETLDRKRLSRNLHNVGKVLVFGMLSVLRSTGIIGTVALLMLTSSEEYTPDCKHSMHLIIISL
jgi:hypothetical protein